MKDKRERLTDGRAPARMSDRAFGVAFAAALAVIAAVARLASAQTLSAWLFVISGALLAVTFPTPRLLSPLNALRARLMDSVTIPPPPSHCGFRRILAIIWWNTLFVSAGLLLVGLAGEAWLRSRAPFIGSSAPTAFVPGVGLLRPPDTEVRVTNGFDYWTTSTTNSWGFLDRDPVDADVAAASCHITAIGDSFVEAVHVPVEDKFHVRLEEMAASKLPELDVTASAYGVENTGQTHQLPWYDEYARPLRPNLVILVFVDNDYWNNHPALYAMRTGYVPDRIPYATAARDADGAISLRPVNAAGPAWFNLAEVEVPRLIRIWGEASRRFLFAKWLWKKIGLADERERSHISARAEELILRLGYESLLDGWDPADIQDKDMLEFFVLRDPPPVFQDALDITAFSLDEFVNRTKRDGAELVILASHTMGPSGDPLFERTADMARERGIPVINQWDYVARHGGKVEDAGFALDRHWSAQGHEWAAEALLEWLGENPRVCDDADAA